MSRFIDEGSIIDTDSAQEEDEGDDSFIANEDSIEYEDGASSNEENDLRAFHHNNMESIYLKQDRDRHNARKNVRLELHSDQEHDDHSATDEGDCYNEGDDDDEYLSGQDDSALSQSQPNPPTDQSFTPSSGSSPAALFAKLQVESTTNVGRAPYPDRNLNTCYFRSNKIPKALPASRLVLRTPPLARLAVSAPVAPRALAALVRLQAT